MVLLFYIYCILPTNIIIRLKVVVLLGKRHSGPTLLLNALESTKLQRWKITLWVGHSRLHVEHGKLGTTKNCLQFFLSMEWAWVVVEPDLRSVKYSHNGDPCNSAAIWFIYEQAHCRNSLILVRVLRCDYHSFFIFCVVIMIKFVIN